MSVQFMLVLGACSESSNFNKILIPSTTEDSFTYLYSQAKQAYDHGNIEKANKYALAAHKIFPDNADNNIVLGLSYLDFSGMSAIKIVRAIVEDSDAKKKEKEEKEHQVSEGLERTNSEEEAAEGQVVNSSSSNSDKSEFFKFFTTMRTAFNLTDQEIQKLGTIRPVPEDLDRFAGYDVLIPDSAQKIRNSSKNYTIEQLKSLKQVICQYIEDDSGLKNESDCKANPLLISKLSLKNKRQFNLLWGFTHLNEAIILAAGIFYTVPGQSDFSLMLKSNTLKELVTEKTNAGVIEYLKYLTNYITDVKDILDGDSTHDSAFVGVIKDLIIAGASITAAMTDKAKNDDNDKNYLKKITNKIDKLLEAKNHIDLINTTDTKENKENQAMQNDLLKAANKKICKQINELTLDEEGHVIAEIDDAKREELCAQYDLLTGVYQMARPTICDDPDPETGEYVHNCDKYGEENKVKDKNKEN